MTSFKTPSEAVSDQTDSIFEVSFPSFQPEVLSRLVAFGVEETFSAGDFLFMRGSRDVDMFVVLEGEVEVIELVRRKTRYTFAVLGRGQFTGELDLIGARQTLFDCRAVTKTRILRIDHGNLRRIMVSEVEIADVIVQACMRRRLDITTRGTGGVTIIGSEYSADTSRVARFLQRNGYPYQVLDPETDANAAFLSRCFELEPEDLPAALLGDQRVLRNPSTALLADELGLTDVANRDVVYDVAIVGAGPAGLAAAVYASSEGLSTIVIEGNAPGGQAGTSSRIENYLGFPNGITGQELSERSLLQAQKFGARFSISRDVVGMSRDDHSFALHLDDGNPVKTRTVVIATGAHYQKLGVANSERFDFQGIHYAATAMEADLCRGQEAAVVGAGNSAGQAALFLSQNSKRIYLLVRGDRLEATMSDYLVQRILSSPRISLRFNTQIVHLEGDDRLKEVTWRDRKNARVETMPISNLFVMIGAKPRTKGFSNILAVDEKGFLKTGSAVSSSSFFGTSLDGVFAVGDVRSGSVKRVASAVGEGSVVIADIHQYLASVKSCAVSSSLGSEAVIPRSTLLDRQSAN
jgi:thioredoxin reductase (NADPH)